MTSQPRWVRAFAACLMLACSSTQVLAAAERAGGEAAFSAPLAQEASGQQFADPQVLPAAPETQTLHIVTGRSVIISTQARMRRIVVSNPEILETVTVSPTELVLTAKAPGGASVVIWDETGQARILDVNSDVDVATLRRAVAQAYPDEDILVEAEHGKVVLSGTASKQDVSEAVAALAATYSKDIVNSLSIPRVAREKQVMLKVRFAEVNRSRLSSFGINILSTGALNTPGTITTQQFGPPGLGAGSISGTIPGGITGTTTELQVSDLLNIFLFRPDLNLGVTIRALQAHNILQILAEPNLLSRSGQPANFIAGGEFPFPVVQAGVGVGTAVTIQFRPFGVRLEFTGTIEEDGIIRLKVAPEVSALDFANALTISGFTIPAISTRRAETEIELRDGQSFGIAGLLDQRTSAQMSKIPGIGDIPILGQLFRSRSTNRSETELLVLVTPTIVDPVGVPVELPVTPEGPLDMLDKEKFDRSVRERIR